MSQTTPSYEHSPLSDDSYFRTATLAQFRWVAIFGQIIAITTAYFLFNVDFNWSLCMIIIGIWGVLNILQQTLFSQQMRMDHRSAFIALLIDLIEITAILGLTGGLNNPFAIFIIAPSLLASTTLNSTALIILVTSSLIALIILAFNAEPITYQGQSLILPMILRIAYFFALTILLVFMSFVARRVSLDNLRITQALAASELALQREHRLSSLGALVAAYAHELGTPLATIRLTAQDLLDENLPEATREEIQIIASEAKRSASILQSMGARGKSDEYVQTLPLGAMIEEAAAPHLSHNIIFELQLEPTGKIIVQRSETIIQGLRNLIQNAADFAKSKVIIELQANKSDLKLRIIDDGPGFPNDILTRIGDPYLRSDQTPDRGAYKGLGLGLFISKTLLERSGAKVDFANRPNPEKGAIAVISWPIQSLEIEKSKARKALGENKIIS